MITYSNFTKIIQSVRDICLKKYPDDIDVITPEKRRSRLEIIEEESLLLTMSLNIKHTVIFKIQELVTSPRLLKMVLRRTYHAWSILHGEIDYDDLFVINVLRFTSPEAYDFLLNNVMEIRGLESADRQYDSHEAKKERLLKKWGRATKNVNWNVTAAEILISFLFPYWEKSFRKYSLVPQGVVNMDPTDYWVRANNETIFQSEIRDQEILRAINGWLNNPNDTSFRGKELPEALYEFPEISDKFEHLAIELTDGKSIRKISEDLFGLILDNKQSAANYNDFPAFLSLWRLSTRNEIEKKEHQKWILNEIFKALPISLYFANELFYYWNNHNRSAVEFKEPCPEIYLPMLEKAKELYEGSPETLIKVIVDNPPYSVSQFIIEFSGPRYTGTKFNPEEWRWIANTLLDAAILQPEVALIQIIYLICKGRPTTSGYINEFDEQLAIKLFAARLVEVMKLLSHDYEYPYSEENIIEKIKFMRQTATEWLENHSEESKSSD